jgi:hypothetical protein
MIQAFPDGGALFEHCVRLNFEGIVAKRVDKPYTSGPAKWWVKVKNPEWARVNAWRYVMFETKPKLTERQRALIKKRQELARVLERLQDADLRAGIERELRKHVAILEASSPSWKDCNCPTNSFSPPRVTAADRRPDAVLKAGPVDAVVLATAPAVVREFHARDLESAVDLDAEQLARGDLDWRSTGPTHRPTT